MIEKITEKITQILKMEELTPEINFADFIANIKKNNAQIHSTFNTVCTGEGGSKYFFKILIKDDPSFRRSIENEINFSLIANKAGFKHFKSPMLLHYEFGEHCWYLRQSYEGTIISDGYSIDDSFKAKAKSYANEAILAVIELNQIVKTGSPFDPALFKTNVIDNYTASLLKNDHFVQKIDTNYIPKAKTYFEKQMNLSLAPLVFCHGDCHLGNFIYQQNSIPYWIDWAVSHWGNIASDFSKLWLSLWQSSESQRLIAELFTKSLAPEQKESFTRNLNSMLLFHCSNKLAWVVWVGNDPKRQEAVGADLSQAALHYFSNLFELILTEKFEMEGLSL